MTHERPLPAERIEVKVRMTESTYARLVNEAADEGCSLSELVTKRLAVGAPSLVAALRQLLDRCPDCGGSGVIHFDGYAFSSEAHECAECVQCDRCGPARAALLAAEDAVGAPSLVAAGEQLAGALRDALYADLDEVCRRRARAALQVWTDAVGAGEAQKAPSADDN